MSSILPKNERKISTFTSSRIVFVRFLGELKTLKRHFEINWPLKPNLASLTALLWACLCCWTTVPKTIKKILLRSPYLPSFSTKCSWETQVLGCTNLCFKRLIQNRQRRRRQIPISIPRLVFCLFFINGTVYFIYTMFKAAGTYEDWSSPCFQDCRGDVNILVYFSKAEFAQEGIYFVLQFFAWWILLIKNLEIEKSKPTFIISVLKVEY